MNLKKKGFQLPEKIRFDEETLTDTYGKIVVEPLERVYGTTLGNSLRRVILSSLEGAAITAVKLSGALHEFSSINGVKEDVIDIILNLKKLRFKFHGEGTRIATFSVKGPAQVTGADLQCDSTIEMLTPQQEIATLDKDANFSAEVHIRKGKGYLSSEYGKEDLPVGMIAVDAAFSPITKVNYAVEKARVGRATDFDRLILEIWTDGSITPRRERYEDISKKFDEIEQRINQHETAMSNLLDRTTFWVCVGILTGLFAWMFIDHISIREKISDIRASYIHRHEWVDWKLERGRRLTEVTENIFRELERKEDAHPGLPEKGH